jgi:hypothetical protein
VIVDVEATPARTYDEVAATKTMIKRTDERLGLKPERLAADTAYGTEKFLGWVSETGITPHIPVWDISSREDGTFSRADNAFGEASTSVTRPALTGSPPPLAKTIGIDRGKVPRGGNSTGRATPSASHGRNGDAAGSTAPRA